MLEGLQSHHVLGPILYVQANGHVPLSVHCLPTSDNNSNCISVCIVCMCIYANVHISSLTTIESYLREVGRCFIALSIGLLAGGHIQVATLYAPTINYRAVSLRLRVSYTNAL